MFDILFLKEILTMKLNEIELIPDFTHHRYVIDMNNPEDWLRHYNEGEEVVNDFILPRGPMQLEVLTV